MNPDHSDSETGSIFTDKTCTTAPTEWTSEEGNESRDGSDVMSILSSLYVCNSSSLLFEGEWLRFGISLRHTDMAVTRHIHYHPAF